MITVMTIAGLDPSAGAGILADVKTISAFGCYGVAAVTAITVQNTKGVFEVRNGDAEVVAGQMRALLEDFEIAAVKTGMLPTAAIVERVAAVLGQDSSRPTVVDPVLRSTTGFPLTDGKAMDALARELMPRATLITPNVAESEHLAGIAVRGLREMQAAAEKIRARGAKAVLVTGGDLGGDDLVDVLADQTGELIFWSERVRSRNTHGTGCALSTALACLLARSLTVREAVPIARRYVAEAIRTGPDLGGGAGPLNHQPPGFCPSL